MKFLLDVNALLALGYLKHEFHPRSTTRTDSLRQSKDTGLVLATCAITEPGFVRILPRVPGFDGGLRGAKALLSDLKSSPRAAFEFIMDYHGADRQPDWLEGPKATTDGHLLALAKAHGWELATLDTGIPGSFLIPG